MKRNKAVRFNTNDRKHIATANFEGGMALKGINSIDSRVGRIEGAIDVGFKAVMEGINKNTTRLNGLSCDEHMKRLGRIENDFAVIRGKGMVYSKLAVSLAGIAGTVVGGIFIFIATKVLGG